jgi:hypothetical protein
MNSPQYNELQKAVEVFRKKLHAQMDLDFSIYSIKNLDDILAITFKDGKYRNPESTFAKNEGQVLLGLSGYLTDVILKNTTNTKLQINSGDEKWYLNFTLTAENGCNVQPAKQVMKRIAEGSTTSLHAFCIATVISFKESKADTINKTTDRREVYFHDEANSKKAWWKFW